MVMSRPFTPGIYPLFNSAELKQRGDAPEARMQRRSSPFLHTGLLEINSRTVFLTLIVSRSVSLSSLSTGV